jgi:hypothetical protein
MKRFMMELWQSLIFSSCVVGSIGFIMSAFLTDIRMNLLGYYSGIVGFTTVVMCLIWFLRKNGFIK